MGWQDRPYNRDDGTGIPPVSFKFPTITRLALVLICVNLGLFLLKATGPLYYHVVDFGALRYNEGTLWQVWRFVTYQYLHANAMHVFFNMLALYFFMPALEQRWGWEKTLGFYTLGGIAAGLTFLLLSAAYARGPVQLVGASGSIFACLGAVALFYPERQIILLIFPIPIRVAAGLFALLFLLTSVGDGDVSDAAHLGGLVFGFAGPWLAMPYFKAQQAKVKQWSVERSRQAEIDEQMAVDRILEKVAASGMHSLNAGEKRTLERASENQRKRDAARSRRY